MLMFFALQRRHFTVMNVIGHNTLLIMFNPVQRCCFLQAVKQHIPMIKFKYLKGPRGKLYLYIQQVLLQDLRCVFIASAILMVIIIRMSRTPVIILFIERVLTLRAKNHYHCVPCYAFISLCYILKVETLIYFSFCTLAVHSSSGEMNMNQQDPVRQTNQRSIGM